MKNILPFLFTLILLGGNTAIYAQKGNVGIGISTPHPTAILHLQDEDPTKQKGFKIPYTDTNAVNAYATTFNPPHPIANGLLIFQKGAETFYYYDAAKAKWIPLSGITGPTGPKGDTGLVGPTGPTGHLTKMRHGDGAPTKIPGDTCDSYYIDVLNASIYRYNCDFGFWGSIGGAATNKIKGGTVMHASSDSLQYGPQGPINGPSPLSAINGLSITIPNKPGYTAYVWAKAWGSVRKRTANNDYNYARFDFANASGELGQKQTVSMGPNGPAPDNVFDIVKWSIAGAFENPGTLYVKGGQIMKGVALGDIVLTGGPGSDTEAHMEVMVIYARN